MGEGQRNLQADARLDGRPRVAIVVPRCWQRQQQQHQQQQEEQQEEEEERQQRRRQQHCRKHCEKRVKKRSFFAGRASVWREGAMEENMRAC